MPAAGEEAGSNGNGRVTTREFYEKLLAIEKEGQERERRILDRLDLLIKSGTHTAQQALKDACEAQEDIKLLDKRVDDIELKFNWWSGANSALTAIGSTLAAILGQKQ